jgi:hypothetical protein
MTWTKLGDEFADECWTLTDAAFRLHVDGLVWNNRKHVDGQLAKDDMQRWTRCPDAAEELVAIGWWEDHGEHYQIIHHIGYQRTREQVARQSIVNAQNRAKGKARPVRPKDDSSDDLSDESSDERDRTGQDRLLKGTNNESVNAENNGFESVPGNQSGREFDDWLAAELEPPTETADGFPLDDGGHR